MRYCVAIVTVILGASAFTASAAPVSYNYFGQVTWATDASVIGVPIAVTATYDPATALVNYNNGTDSWIASSSGSAFGTPWVTWLNLTATYGGHTFENDMQSGFVNAGHAAFILDNAVDSSVTYIDSYEPFIAEQLAYDSRLNVVQERYASWYIQSTGYLPDVSAGGLYDLTSGLSFPQTIDFSKGQHQYGELVTLDPGTPPSFVEFTLDTLDVPNVSTVPEPGALALLGIGFVGLGFSRKAQ